MKAEGKLLDQNVSAAKLLAIFQAGKLSCFFVILLVTSFFPSLDIVSDLFKETMNQESTSTSLTASKIQTRAAVALALQGAQVPKGIAS